MDTETLTTVQEARIALVKADDTRLHPAYKAYFTNALMELLDLGYADDATQIIDEHRASIIPNRHIKYGKIEDSKPVGGMLEAIRKRIEHDEEEQRSDAKRYRLTFANGTYSEWWELPNGTVLGMVQAYSFYTSPEKDTHNCGESFHLTRANYMNHVKNTGHPGYQELVITDAD